MKYRKAIYTKVTEPAKIKLLIPYTKPTAQLQTVVDCIRIQAVQPVLVKTGPGDDYWTMIRDAWEEGDEFFIVEQDVIVWQGGLRQLDECPQDWCTFPTMCHGRMISTTLGCVKFGKQMIERNPGLLDDIETTWYHLDASIADKMGWPYFRPHAHWPPATHLNEVQWPDSISTRFMLERKIVWQSMEAGGEAIVKAVTSEANVLDGVTQDKE